MSLIQKYEINKENAGSIIGSIHHQHVTSKYAKFRGKIVSTETLNAIIDEANLMGLGDWGKYKVMNSNEVSIAQMDTNELIKGNDFILAATNDAALAALYLYKLKNSNERGISFELSLADLKRIISKKTCYFTGRRFCNESGSMDKLSLDRLDNSIGYTKENTVPCCLWVNQLKNELFENPRSSYRVTISDLSKIVDKMKKINIKGSKSK